MAFHRVGVKGTGLFPRDGLEPGREQVRVNLAGCVTVVATHRVGNGRARYGRNRMA